MPKASGVETGEWVKYSRGDKRFREVGGVSELEMTPEEGTMEGHKLYRTETACRASNFSCYQRNDRGVVGVSS